MPNAVWTGTLSFGLVTIPIKLYPATQAKDVRFHLVDPASGRRVRYRRVVETDAAPRPWPSDADVDAAQEQARNDADVDEAPERTSAAPPPTEADPPTGPMPPTTREVAYDDLARGYEVGPGRFVTLERAEIEAARPARSTTIAIEEFVDLDRIDPVYFDKSYYIAPTRDGERPYVLLLRAMERAALVGVGRFVLRSKPHLVAIRPMERALGLETLYFSDEVRPAQDIVRGLDAFEAPARELALAEQLITMLRNDWDPTKYADDYREELRRIIAERTPAAIEEPADRHRSAPRVSELMDALKASIDAAKEEQAPARRKRRAG